MQSRSWDAISFPQLQGGSAFGTGNAQRASHFSGGSTRSPEVVASVLLPGPRHQAGMGAGHPRAGKHQHPHQRGFHKPRLPGSPLSLPTTTPKQVWLVCTHWELLPLFPAGFCASEGNRGPGGRVSQPAWLQAVPELGFPISSLTARPRKAVRTRIVTWYVFRKCCNEVKQLHNVLPPGLGLRGPSDLLLPFIPTASSPGPQFPCWV